MASQWFVIRNEKKTGPFSSEQLKTLAGDGRISATDLIWREGMAAAVPASKVSGLMAAKPPAVFAAATPAIPDPAPRKADPVAEVPPVLMTATDALAKVAGVSSTAPSAAPTLLQRAKSQAMTLAVTAKAAAQLAANRAERTKIGKVDLPAAYAELGKQLHNDELRLPQFSSLYDAIDKLQSEIQAVETDGAKRTAPQGLADKAKAAAAAAKDMAQVKSLQLRIRHAHGELGKGAFEQKEAFASSPERFRPIETARARIAALDAEIERLSQQYSGKQVTPKRLLVGGVAVLLLVACVYIGASKRDSRATASAPGSVKNSTSRSNSSNTSYSGNEDDVDEVVRVLYEDLPKELQQAASQPHAPYTNLASKVARESDSGREVRIFWSPTGSIVFVLHGDGEDQKVRLVRTATGEELTAKAGDCDYFSYPAVFAPHLDRLACLDGDTLRIWDLTSSPAAQVASLAVSSQKLSGSSLSNWTALTWAYPDTIVLAMQSGAIDARAFQAIRVEDTRLALHGPLCRTDDDDQPPGIELSFPHTMCTISPDGKFWATAYDVFVEGGNTSGVWVRVRDVASGADVKTVKLTGNVSGNQTLQQLKRRFPPTGLAFYIEPTTGTLGHELRSSLAFSPTGKSLFVSASDSDAKRGELRIIDTATWDEVGMIPDGEEPLRLLGFSPDGKYLTAEVVKSTRSAKGTKLASIVTVYDAMTGQLAQEVDAESGWENQPPEPDGLNQMERRSSAEPSVRAAFTRDGRLVVASSKVFGWIQEKGRADERWVVTHWNMADASRQSLVRGEGIAISWSPTGEDLVTELARKAQVWHIPHLVKLQTLAQTGDVAWASGDRQAAARNYAEILADSMAWTLRGRTPELWGRCIDAYVESGGDGSNKARNLALYALDNNLPMTPETAGGRSLQSKVIQERQAQLEKIAQQRAVAAEKRLQEYREKNKAKRVPARSITRAVFVEKMRQTMNRGILDSRMTNAVFENYAFSDVFGSPDQDIEWTNSQRLYHYRCADGMIQLTVLNVGAMVIVQGVNLY